MLWAIEKVFFWRRREADGGRGKELEVENGSLKVKGIT